MDYEPSRKRERVAKILKEPYAHGYVIAFLTILIVIVAAGQLYKFIEFNKLSVQPRIAIEYDQTGLSSTLKATNMGGVAILHGVNVKNVETGQYYSDWKSVSRDISGNKSNFMSCGDFVEGYPFAEDKVRTLLSVSGSSINKKMPIEVSICYCSVYEDCWVTTFLKRDKENNIRIGDIEDVKNCSSFKMISPQVICNANEY